MIIKESIIPKGSILFRFVDLPPSDVKQGMSNNKWKNGRCNKHQSIYYCARSINALKTEFPGLENAKGSIIKAEVLEDIKCGYVADPETHKKLRGRIPGEEPTIVHKEILSRVDYDEETTYKETNRIADAILRKYPEGMVYSSVRSIDVIAGDTPLYIADEDSDFGPFENVALTVEGFKKIKQFPAEKWPG